MQLTRDERIKKLEKDVSELTKRCIDLTAAVDDLVTAAELQRDLRSRQAPLTDRLWQTEAMVTALAWLHKDRDLLEERLLQKLSGGEGHFEDPLAIAEHARLKRQALQFWNGILHSDASPPPPRPKNP